MMPEELLRVYPRETLGWLRGWLGLSQQYLADILNVVPTAVSRWETGHHAIAPQHRAQLAALLAPHLATPEGAAFTQSLRRGAE